MMTFHSNFWSVGGFNTHGAVKTAWNYIMLNDDLFLFT